MTESNDIIQSFVKNVFEHNDVDFEALSVATKKMAESAFEASKVDFTSIQIAAKQMLKVLETSKKLDDKTKNQYVSDEANNLANDIVYKLEDIPTFKDCTFNINVPEKSNKWTLKDTIDLISLIVEIISLCIAFTSMNSAPSSTVEMSNEILQEIDKITIDTSKLSEFVLDANNSISLDKQTDS